MRHRKKINHLSRTSAHRKAMLANMACSLIMHKRIHTTLAKAKALKIYVEPLITKSKDDTTHSRRVVFGYLKDKEAVSELYREVATKIASRPGGYTRVLKTGNRLGDNAEMCFIELVDFNENMMSEKKDAKKASRKRRGGAKKASTAPKAVVEAPVSEEPKAEEAVVVEEAVKTEDVVEVVADAATEVEVKTEEETTSEEEKKEEK